MNLDELYSKLEDRFSRIDNKLEELDIKIDTKIEELDRKIDDVHKELNDKIDQNQKELLDKMFVFENDMTMKLDNLYDKIELDNQMDSLKDTERKSVINKFVEHDAYIHRLDIRISKLERENQKN